jgi:hypothetical protein
MLGYGAGRLRSWGVGGGWGLADDALRFGGALALAAHDRRGWLSQAQCHTPHGRIGSGCEGV